MFNETDQHNERCLRVGFSVTGAHRKLEAVNNHYSALLFYLWVRNKSSVGQVTLVRLSLVQVILFLFAFIFTQKKSRLL